MLRSDICHSSEEMEFVNNMMLLQFCLIVLYLASELKGNAIIKLGIGFSFLTEVAGEGGPHLAPQKFLLSQQFRYLMRCKKYLKKNFLSCLVSEIQLFVYIFG